MKTINFMSETMVLVITVVWSIVIIVYLNLFSIRSIFIPKMKIIKGKIIRPKIKNIYVSFEILNNSDDYITRSISPSNFVVIPDFRIFFKEENKNKGYFISIPENSYKDICDLRSLGFNHVKLYFKSWFLWSSFDHFEFEPVL